MTKINKNGYSWYGGYISNDKLKNIERIYYEQFYENKSKTVFSYNVYIKYNNVKKPYFVTNEDESSAAGVFIQKLSEYINNLDNGIVIDQSSVAPPPPYNQNYDDGSVEKIETTENIETKRNCLFFWKK